jgi:hypothetical protein
MERTLTTTPAAFARVIKTAAALKEQSWSAVLMRNTLTTREAVVQAMDQHSDVPAEFVQPITYLLYLAWNDIQSWAERQ